MVNNQRGVTLTELLVTLAILSFAGILIWSIFFQGYKFSETATTKNRLNQEANIVIANLTNIHQTSEYYKIYNTTPCEIYVEITNTAESATVQTMEFKDSELCFESNSDRETPILITTPDETVVNQDPFYNDLEIEIVVSDKMNPTNKVTVDTVLYRVKDGGV
ncbi:type II secretion system protein J [Mesobacillus maritimus]|uniref:PulJ/GspJ family protein n=1 Tax=Mesobacillus maritimus TaxID=1643336 RepID=UPI00384E9FCF